MPNLYYVDGYNSWNSEHEKAVFDNRERAESLKLKLTDGRLTGYWYEDEKDLLKLFNQLLDM